MFRRDLIWSDCSDLIWSDFIWSDLTWSDPIWPDVIWSDSIWFDLVSSHLTRSNLIWSDLVWSEFIWSDLIWHHSGPHGSHIGETWRRSFARLYLYTAKWLHTHDYTSTECNQLHTSRPYRRVHAKPTAPRPTARNRLQTNSSHTTDHTQQLTAHY